jgi:heme/copper-type cytochrome/quinol oxidase subunit 2
MKHFRSARGFLVVIIGLWLLLSAAVQYGQGCAMCYTSMANSTQAKRAEKTLNAAILILLLPAATMFAGIFLVAYKYRNAFNSDPGSEMLSLSIESYPLMAPPNDLLRSDTETSPNNDIAARKRVA